MNVPAAVAASRSNLDIGGLDISDVTICPMPWWMSYALGSGVAAMTIANSIFVAGSWYDKVIDGEQPDLLRHELVHVAQWRMEGRARFLARYIGDYVRNRLMGLSHRVAYRAIGFEAEAFDVSERTDRRWP